MKMKPVSVIKNGVMVFSLIILGKVFSLVREMCFSAFFGTSLYADAYFTANIVPSLLNTPLTVSSLVFFIPLYSQCKETQGKAAADRFVSNLMTIYVVFNISLALLAIFLSPVMIRLIVPEYSGELYTYTVNLSRLLVLSFPVTIAVSILINVSNANQKHFAPQLLTVTNSLISIVCMYLFVPRYGIYAMPIIGVIAWFIQLLIQGFCVRKEYRYKFYVSIRDPLIKSMILLAIPTIVATAAEQINLSVDNILASSLDAGSVSVLNYVQKLFNLLNGTITTALITVSYPIISKLYAEKRKDALVNNVNQYFNIIIFIMLPVMALCMILREDIVRLIFARGAFGEESIYIVANIFMIYVIAILGAAIKELVTRIFYVYGEAKIPMLVNSLCIVINIVLNVICVRFWGLKGIAGATAIATTLSCVIECICFRKKFVEERQKGIFTIKSAWKYFVALGCIYLSGFSLYQVLGNLHYIIKSSIIGFACLLLYVVLLILLREPLCLQMLQKFADKRHQGNV